MHADSVKRMVLRLIRTRNVVLDEGIGYYPDDLLDEIADTIQVERDVAFFVGVQGRVVKEHGDVL